MQGSREFWVSDPGSSDLLLIRCNESTSSKPEHSYSTVASSKAIINDDIAKRYTKLKFSAKILSTMFVVLLSHLFNEFLQPRWESVLSRFD